MTATLTQRPRNEEAAEAAATAAEPLEKIHCCTARPIPEGRLVEAAIRSIEENPANAPMKTPEAAGGAAHEPAAMAVLTEHRWRPGRTLKVSFLDGEPAVQRKVEEVARRWEDYANLRLDFGDHPDADIRISFAHSGSWSYLGTVALAIEAPEATMNYGWLDPDSSQDAYDRVVLHEFGHALGAVHEHQHPEGGIPWDEEQVVRYYEATQGWDLEKIRRNVLEVYSRDATNFSAFDPTSIMQYPVPNELTVGDFEVGWNRELSATDRRFAGQVYPFEKPRARVLTPGSAVGAEIAEHGDEDRFSFTLTEAGRYSLETSGATDVVMSVFGPDDETALVTWDDDSGAMRNARVETHFEPGRYVVRVRHFWPRGRGHYRVRLDHAGHQRR